MDDPCAQDRRLLGVIAMIAFACVTCIAGLSAGPRLGDHESINALAARQILQSGDWLIPKLGDVPRIRKGPLGIWLIAASSNIVRLPVAGAPGSERDDSGVRGATVEARSPVSAFSARLPSAIAGVGTALTVYWLGLMMFGHRTGLVAGIVAAGSGGVIMFARNAQVDMVLTLFTVLSYACFWRGAMSAVPSRRWMAAFYVSFALAMLAKAPLPLATVALPLALFWFVATPIVTATTAGSPRRIGLISSLGERFRRLNTLWLIPGLILFLVLFGAWPAYVLMKVPNALALWRVEYLSRFTGEMSDKASPFWYYIPILLVMAAPFMLSLPEALIAVFLRRYADRRMGLAYVFTWALIGTAFVSVSAFKRPHYLLSIYPAYCLMLGPVIERLFFRTDWSKVARMARVAGFAVPVVLLAAAVLGAGVVDKSYASLTHTYVRAACIVVPLWIAAAWAYSRRRGMSSFALLNLGTVALLLIGWPALGREFNINAEADALAAEMRSHGIGTDAAIYCVDGRPDSSIEFYHGFRIKRLIDEMESTSLREDRRELSRTLIDATANRVADLLHQDKPVYMIIAQKYYDLLSRRPDFTGSVLFRMSGFHDDAEDETVVFTQPASATKEVPTQ